MAYSKQRLREATKLQREAVRRIQTDIGEIHPSPSRRYIQEFNEEFEDFETLSDHEEVLQRALDTNLIWIGDYHALTNNKLYVVYLVKQLTRLKGDVALAVEPIFARNQEILDLWMLGEMSEHEFLERIHYHEEWGCEWTGYRAIFNTARELGVPVYGVDSHPRNDMR